MKKFIRLFGLILSISGVAVSALLIYLHGQAGGSDDILGRLCGRMGDCDRILSSRWAYFPPVSTDAGISGGASIPVAVLGVGYFGAFAVWFGAFGSTLIVPRWLARSLLGVATLGAMVSVGFTVLMSQVIKGICPWCMASHLINFAMFGCVFWEYRRSRLVVSSLERPVEQYSVEIRSLVLSGFLVASLWFAAVLGHRWFQSSLEVSQAKAALAEIQKDADVLELAFYGQDATEISLREDAGAEELDRDPTSDAVPGYRNTLIVFGDAECSACRRFHEMIDRDIRPAYGNHLRVIFKHLPLVDIHPDALRAARALEAARCQGKFWELLELLYERQDSLAGVDFGDLANEMGMDLEQFLDDMESESTGQRIQEDIELAAALGIEATPAVYLNGRRVSGAMRNLTAFWRGQAERLRQQREKAGQTWNSEALAGETRD